MRFQVPQFTDVEDKIIGPLTLKQFIYLGGAGGICAVIYFLVPITAIAFLLMIPVAILGGLLAFYKINNKPFINAVEYFFKYSIANKLYIWKKEEKTTKTPRIKPEPPEGGGSEEVTSGLTKNKLRELASSLDIQDLSKESQKKL